MVTKAYLQDARVDVVPSCRTAIALKLASEAYGISAYTGVPVPSRTQRVPV